MEPRRMLISALAAALVLVAAPACDDDGGVLPPLAELDALWPNDNGRGWRFTARQLAWQPDAFDTTYLFASADLVPPFPGWDEILAYLVDVPPPVDPDTTESTVFLHFEGTVVTPTFVTAQNLQEYRDGSSIPLCGAPAPGGHHWLSTVLESRPLTRDALRTMLEPFDPIELGPVLLHGGAFEKTDATIGTYSCLDTLLNWKFLEANLVPGATFTMEIIPSFDTGPILHARVGGSATVFTPAGRFEAVEVLYAVDSGVLEFGAPEPFGYMRLALLGRVYYAPEVGPVGSFEQDFIPVGVNGFGDGARSTTLTLEWTGVQLPD